MTVYHRYPLDPTGNNPDNYVSGELHTLSDRPKRVLTPRYGPFFTERNLILYDHMSNTPLVKGVDYIVPTISREASLKFGEEIADAILIENTAISSQVRVSYQTLGGEYQNNISNLVAIYEAVINDSRNIDWATGIYGKPAAYPPGPHAHWLSDIFGFEPLTFQLERIAQAILLGHAPAYELIYQSIKNSTATMEDVERGEKVEKWLTLEGLIHALDKYNFNTITVTPREGSIRNGSSLWLDVEATHVPDDERWYWTIEHVDTEASDFVLTSGILDMRYGRGRAMVQSSRDLHREDREFFRVQIRRNSPTGMVIGRSLPLSMSPHFSFSKDSLLPALTVPDINSPRLRRSAKVYAVNMSVWSPFFS